MTNVAQFRPRKPNRRQGALPASAPAPRPEYADLWLQIYREESARLARYRETSARMTDAGVLKASSR
jgi:hypothetical protein